MLEDAEDGSLWLVENLEKQNGLLILRGLDRLNANLECNHAIVHINSNGGDMYWALAISDMIRRSRIDITTIVHGNACSAGCLILACGNIRQAEASSTILFHGSWSSPGWQKTQDAQRWTEAAVEREKRMCNIMAEKTLKPFEFWWEIVEHGRDYWMGSEEALELGIIDKIL